MMDKVWEYAGYALWGAIALALAIAIVVELLREIRKVRFVYVPDGHVGLYVKTGEQPNADTPLLKKGRHRRRFFHTLHTYPVVEVPEDALGLVYAHIGQQRSEYTEAVMQGSLLGDYTNIDSFMSGGGLMGFQDVMLPAGTYMIHPYAFTVVVISGNGADTSYGAMGLPEETAQSLWDAAPYVRYLDGGCPVLVVEPVRVDSDLESQLNLDWAASGLRAGWLVDYHEVALFSGSTKVLVGIEFPVSGRAARVQEFVHSTLRPLLAKLDLSNPASFIIAINQWHVELRQTFGDGYWVTVSRATFAPMTALCFDNPNDHV